MSRDLTTGQPTKQLILFALPVLLGNLFQQVYNLADLSIVGRFLGTGALAAVGSTGSLNFMVLGFCFGLCTGFCIPIARSFGARDIGLLRRYLFNLIVLTVALSVVLSIGTASVMRVVLHAMNTPADIFEDAYGYITIIFGGIFVTMAYNILANLSRAIGDSHTPVIFLVMATILNIGLDLLLIVNFKWGVAGAAVATVAAQACSAVACFVYMNKRFPELHLGRGDCRIEWGLVGELLRMGLPMALQFSITAIGSVILSSAVNPYGSMVVATVSAGFRVQMLLTQPIEAVCVSMATFASQNLGAKRIDRIKTCVWQILIILAGVSLVGWWAGVQGGHILARLFIDGEHTEILAGIHQYLFVVGMFFFPLGSLMIFRNAIQGLGYAMSAMVAGLFEMVARSFVAIMFVRRFGFDAVCFANPAAWIAANVYLLPAYTYVIRRVAKRVPPPQTT
ncbi:MATE family efflux transporter [Clostridia bacterium]|nr:MATE family efflux transporter [Clostridia bacterium]